MQEKIRKRPPGPEGCWLHRSPGPPSGQHTSREPGRRRNCGLLFQPASLLLPICIPVSSSEPLSSKTPSRGGSVAACQWFELLLPSTRGMVSKLEVISTSGGRRKIPSGFVRELRQRCLQGRRRMCSPTPEPCRHGWTALFCWLQPRE